ncbi:hypothetical protein N9051_01770 [Akkermansiaceae bacterium]|nr:hypothetical protein [Akkermansiaceae bacterium]
MKKSKLKTIFTVVLVMIAIYMQLKDSDKPSDYTPCETDKGKLI